MTLGMIADMWDSEHQQYAVAFVVFSSVGGSVLGPIVGGFSESFLAWRSVSLSILIAILLTHIIDGQSGSSSSSADSSKRFISSSCRRLARPL